MAIPRIIHQTVKSRRALDPAFEANIAALRSRNPDWEHRLYDDHDLEYFLRNRFPSETLELFERINPIYGPARADFFRYHLMYLTGGVYLDIKSTALSSLDDVLETSESYVLSHWSNPAWGRYPELGADGEFQQWHIVCEPQHPFLAAVIARVCANIRDYHLPRFGAGKMGVLRTTGPIAYTLAIAEVLDRHPHRIVDIGELGFRYSVFETPGDKLAHERYFPSHYRQSCEPVILPARRPQMAMARPKLAGRNDPCPCGSGKKYKHCHAAK